MKKITLNVKTDKEIIKEIQLGKIDDIENSLMQMSTEGLYKLLISPGIAKIYQDLELDINGDKYSIVPLLLNKETGEVSYINTPEIKESLVNEIIRIFKVIPNNEIRNSMKYLVSNDDNNTNFGKNILSLKDKINKNIVKNILKIGFAFGIVAGGIFGVGLFRGNSDVVGDDLNNSFKKERKINYDAIPSIEDPLKVLDKNNITENNAAENNITENNITENSTNKVERIIKDEITKKISEKIGLGDNLNLDNMTNTSIKFELRKMFLKENIIHISKDLEVSEEEFEIIKKYAIEKSKSFSIEELRGKIKNRDLSRYKYYANILVILFPGKNVKDSQIKFIKFVIGANKYDNKNLIINIPGPKTLEFIQNYN